MPGVIDIGCGHVDCVLDHPEYGAGSSRMRGELESLAWSEVDTVISTSCSGQGTSEHVCASRLNDVRMRLCPSAPKNFTIYSAWEAFVVEDNDTSKANLRQTDLAIVTRNVRVHHVSLQW